MHFSYLVLILHDSILLLPHADLRRLVLTKRSLLLQLRAPEGLNGVHGGAELAFLHIHLLPQKLVLPEHLLELGLQIHDGVVPRLPQRMRHGGSQRGRHVMVSEGDGVGGHGPRATGGDVRAASHHGRADAVRHPSTRAAQRHCALRQVRAGRHHLVVAQVHGARRGVGSIERLDVLHGEGFAPRTHSCPVASCAVGPAVAQTRRARETGRAAGTLIAPAAVVSLHFANRTGATVHGGFG